RMFLQGAELLVFDDLSSALDVETERQLWEGLFESHEATCLVVSHRRAALERADRVIVMEAGRVVAQGSLAQVMEASPELRLLVTGSSLPEERVPGVAELDQAVAIWPRRAAVLASPRPSTGPAVCRGWPAPGWTPRWARRR